MGDSWATPEWVMELVRNYFDPCPLNDNWTVNGLEIEWGEKTYCNPPFSNPLPWVKKAIEENKKGKLVVMMLNVDMTTKWYRELLDNGAHFIYFAERLKFLENGLPMKGSNNKPNMLAILSSPYTRIQSKEDLYDK